MVNRTSKGRRRELQARKQLEKRDYLVEKKNASRFQSNDLWETFDLIAIKPDGSDIRLIQVKSNISDFYNARNHVTDWVIDNNISNISCECWLRENYKPWRKWVYLEGCKPCGKHSFATPDTGSPEASNFKLKRCPDCGFFVKEKPAKD